MLITADVVSLDPHPAVLCSLDNTNSIGPTTEQQWPVGKDDGFTTRNLAWDAEDAKPAKSRSV